MFTPVFPLVPARTFRVMVGKEIVTNIFNCPDGKWSSHVKCSLRSSNAYSHRRLNHQKKRLRMQSITITLPISCGVEVLYG